MGACVSSSRKAEGSTTSTVQRYFIAKSQDSANLTIAEFTPQPGLSLTTCNGLVLFARFLDTTSEIFITNPTTKHLIKLQPPTPMHGSVNFVDHVLGMTYLPSTHQYKIIHYYICNSNNKMLGCEILVLDDSAMWSRATWRVVKLYQTRLDHCRQSNKIIFINNVAHWMVSEIDDRGTVNYSVISLDIAEEEFYKTDLPNCLYEEVEVLEIRGALCLLSPAKDGVVNRFEKWDMKGVGKEGWVKQQSIDLGRNLRIVSVFASVVFDYEQILIYGVNDQPYSYHAYDIRTKATISLQSESESKSSFIDSLVLKTLKFP